MDKEEYRAKQEERKQRFEELAEKNEEKSKESYEQSNKLANAIPFGQPILVGHHSERRHRNHIKKIHNAMDKSMEFQKKSEYYNDKVEAIENNTSISSDDPEAVKKLKEKLKTLEERRAKIKENNKLKKQDKLIAAPYVLANLSQNINSVKKRITQLEKSDSVEYQDREVKGVKVIHNKDINRIQLEFPGIPEQEVRSNLKQWGFRWSPREGRWQRHLNNAGIYATKRVLEKIEG